MDWTMFMWWEIYLPLVATVNQNALFKWLRTLLLNNLAHNTVSLPHAIVELAVSTSRDPVTTNMLSHTLGAQWKGWTAHVDMAILALKSGEFKCVGVDVQPYVTVDQTYYRTQLLRNGIETN